MRESLMDRAEQQPALFDSRQMGDALFAENETKSRNPEFTAARLFDRKPDVYRLIVALRAEGLSAKQTSDLLKVSRNTIAAIDKREAGSQTAEQYKRDAVFKYRHLIRLTMERLEEMIVERDDLQPRDIAVVLGVLEDKAQLLSGGPTARLEVTGGEMSHEDLLDYIRKQKTAYEAEYIAMGNEGENGKQTRADAGPALLTAGSEADPGAAGHPAKPGAEAETPAGNQGNADNVSGD